MQVGEVQKGTTAKLQVDLSQYKGYLYVDIREWFNTDGKDWKPSRRGVTLSDPKAVHELACLVEQAAIKLEAELTPVKSN